MSSATTMSVEEISPAVASKMLEGNTQNRNLRERVVDQYARDMMSGRWADQGDALRFNCDGTLLDGQHRLHAIVASNTTQKMVVVRGVDKSAILTMDTGARRSMADVLRLHGYDRVSTLAAAARFMMLYEQGGDVRDRVMYTHSEMMEWIENNPDLPGHVRKMHGAMNDNGIVRKAITPLIAIRHYAADKGDVDAFVEALRTGTGIFQGNPIHTLRRTLENWATASQLAPVPIVVQASVIKAWNAYLRGEELHVLRFKPGGGKPEAFPKILKSAN